MNHTFYRLRWTDKDGNTDTLAVTRNSTGNWIYTTDNKMHFHTTTIKVILGLAQAIRKKKDVIIHEDTIKELETRNENTTENR